MIHVFKRGGVRGAEPDTYSIECINEEQLSIYQQDGWHQSLDDALAVEVKPASASADANGDGKLSADEAKAYLDSIGVDYSGLHWKKVVALAEQHMKGEK